MYSFVSIWTIKNEFEIKSSILLQPTNYFPADVGLPFTPEMSGLKVAMQVHYNNPDRLSKSN